MFAEHSWYFRNALVRANYENISQGVYRTEKYLVRLLSNVVFGEKNILKNREMHIRSVAPENVDVKLDEDTNVGVKKMILDNLRNNSQLTAQELAVILHKTTRTIERNIKELREKGILSRIGSDKTGHWQIN